MNLTKSFISSLKQSMRKATRPLGSMDSLNPCRWRGKRLHHHGGDDNCVSVLWVATSSGCHYSSYVEKYHNITYNLKLRIFP